MHSNASRANNLARSKSVLSRKEWDELHDSLSLAIDALGDGPNDVDGPFLINCVLHQRGALRLAHKIKERMEGRQ